MQAYVLEKGKLHVTTMPEPKAKDGEVIVRLKVAGLNRRDLYIESRVGVKDDPLILGSDGAGIIEDVGAGVTDWQVGDEVIINPSLGWDQNSAVPPEGYEILGMPDHGTLAEKIAISVEQIEKRPSLFSWEEAGVLALAGLTGYRALFTRGNVQKGDTVFIPGAGSGVASFLIQFAKAAGARVIVTSRDEHKREAALELGADRAIATESDWTEELKDETVDLVIESIGAATFNRSLQVVKRGGTIVVFGATTEDVVSLNLRDFFYGQYNLLGSTMGSRAELREMIQFCESNDIKPVVGKTFPLTRCSEAFQFLKENKQFGKIAITI